MGNLRFTTNTDLVRTCKCYGFETVALVDSQYDLADLNIDPNLVQLGSILLPSYDAITEYINGNEQSFMMAYTNQLTNRDCDEFLSLIAYALFQDRQILLYVGEEQTVVPYIDTLANYIRQSFGITLGVDSDPGFVDPNYYSSWIARFYQYGFITCEEFISKYVPNLDIPMEVLNKLTIDLPPVDEKREYVFANIINCNTYYKSLVNSAHGIVYTKIARPT